MENLTKVEIMLIKTCVIATMQNLEEANKRLQTGEMSTSDLTQYAANQSLYNDFQEIIRKLS